MLSSQQRLLLRVARRKVPSRNALLFRHWQQQQQQGSLAAFSTFPSFPGNSSRRDQDSTTPSLTGMPILGTNVLAKTTVLERAYPLGMGKSPVVWFSSAAAKEQEEEEKKSMRERASEYGDRAKQGAQSFGGMMQKYGPAFVGTYLSVYVANLSLFYLGIESGVLDPMTILGYITGNHEEVRSSAEVVSELMEHYTITAPFAETVQAKPHLANFSIAWISTKFTEPVRFGLSVAIVPSVARFMGIVPNNEAVEEEAAAEAEVKDDADKQSEGESKGEQESKSEEEKKP